MKVVYFLSKLLWFVSILVSPLTALAVLGETSSSIDDKDIHMLAILFAAASYCKKQALQSWNCGIRCEGESSGSILLEHFSLPKNDVTGYVALNHAQKTIIVAYRGSESLRNWLMNLKTWKGKTNWPNSDGHIHSGFLKGYMESAEIVRKHVISALIDNPDYDVLCVGHSLGGALSSLAAVDLREIISKDDTQIRLITFGAPRVGDFRWSLYIQSKLKGKIHRWVNKADVVPHLPPRVLGFVHFPQEIWINVEDSIISCDVGLGEDECCSNSLQFPSSVTDHLQYLGVYFGPFC